jgi:hypothetical protein
MLPTEAVWTHCSEDREEDATYERMKAEGRIEREGYDTEGHKKYYRTVIRESMERSGLS